MGKKTGGIDKEGWGTHKKTYGKIYTYYYGKKWNKENYAKGLRYYYIRFVVRFCVAGPYLNISKGI